MRTPTTLSLLLLCLGGFAFSLYRAGAQSGTEDGNLWLLTSLIVGVALISTCLAVIAQFGRLRTLATPRSDRYAWHNPHEAQRSPSSHQAADRSDIARDRHRSAVGTGNSSKGR